MTTRVKKKLPDPKETLAMRERQSVAASVITERLGPFVESHPELWAHRTFLLIVGKVYEHLVLCKGISPKEFVDLTKTLAESCKIDAKNESGDKKSVQNLGLGGVVDGLEEMVRQIYGTNLQGTGTNSPPSEPAITKPN